MSEPGSGHIADCDIDTLILSFMVLVLMAQQREIQINRVPKIQKSYIQCKKITFSSFLSNWKSFYNYSASLFLNNDSADQVNKQL
jgi:hypothetical protein